MTMKDGFLNFVRLYQAPKQKSTSEQPLLIHSELLSYEGDISTSLFGLLFLRGEIAAFAIQE